ncbi:MAG: hypothetical protein INQ03_23245 [Candidatus Heimdallarchaeota archaeon]|nr:hypothetical protein [Candidatus Heimdallarchaeota archaeon]
MVSKNFPPQLVFWCNQCNAQKKGIKVDFTSTEKFQQQRQCPTCSSNVLQFWAPVTSSQENKMILGVGLFAGGIISSMVVPMIQFTVPGIIVAIIALIAGLIVAFPNFNQIKSISQPPADASEIPPKEQLEDQMKYILNFALRMGGIAILVLVIAIIL